MLNGFKAARIIAGLTQAEVADKLGVSTVAVCHWESGKTFPRVNRIHEVADVLNTTVEQLLKHYEIKEVS